MKIHSLRWLFALCAMLALAVTGLAAPGRAALAQPERVTLTVDGVIDAIDRGNVQVAGAITEMDGTAGDWGIGTPVTLTVIPARWFQGFEVDDPVIVSGTLLPDGATLRASQVQLGDEEDDADESDDEDEGEDETRGHCPDGEPTHPADKLAEAFGVEATWVMEQFCDGFGFGEIKLALRIAEKVGEGETDEDELDLAGMAEDLLDEKSEGQGWGNVIRAHELSPSEVNPGLGAGKPDDAGKPDHPGRPEDPGSQGRGHRK